ncbi:hypothetical protein B0H19DRAFT_1248948 [Mycena capillaripes]|nr:hypothetical protein B0H19DRAFT_1248948 [Mycena capillaripes]
MPRPPAGVFHVPTAAPPAALLISHVVQGRGKEAVVIVHNPTVEARMGATKWDRDITAQYCVTCMFATEEQAIWFIITFDTARPTPTLLYFYQSRRNTIAFVSPMDTQAPRRPKSKSWGGVASISNSACLPSKLRDELLGPDFMVQQIGNIHLGLQHLSSSRNL